MAQPDRLALLLAQNALTGIDFVFVHPDQTTLDVYFLHHDPGALVPSLVGAIGAGDVAIESTTPKQTPQQVAVTSAVWTVVAARRVLTLTTAQPGGFADYRLTIAHAQIDPFFNRRAFNFKAACERPVDCAPTELGCPEPAELDVQVDYLARDFWSLRRALLDFASQRYPRWHERSAADVGVMLTEVISALGDELSYAQDRIAREAYLETARERRSLRRHARLVDYQMHDGRGASGFIDVTCADGQNGSLLAGDGVVAVSEDGTRSSFEVGRGLSDALAGSKYPVDSARNSFTPHLWNAADACLLAGSTELWIEGHQAANLPLDDVTPGLAPGRWVILLTHPSNPATPARRVLVRLTSVEQGTDPLVNHPTYGHDVTRVAWRQSDAPEFDLALCERDPTTGELSPILELRANIVPITAGATFSERFVIGPTFDLQSGPVQEFPPSALERQGRDGAIAYLRSLAASEDEQLVFLGANPRSARPELALFELRKVGAVWLRDRQWARRRSLLESPASQSEDAHFTLDDGQWRRVVGWWRGGEEVAFEDYAARGGFTLRFGDGEFGAMPTEGSVFEVLYRVGGGARSNVAADTVRNFPDAWTFVARIANPLPTSGGLEPERPRDVRELAPEAFRYITYRAVRPEDYARAAERLDWVQRAGAQVRWTGSWLTTFVTPDPRDANELLPSRKRELERALERVRMAGREVSVEDPVYADLDLVVRICVAPGHFAGDVGPDVMEVLFGPARLRQRRLAQTVPFFDPDRFSFGTPLDRAALEAAIQAVPGVRAVEHVRVRRRGKHDFRALRELIYRVARYEIIRVENDPLKPDHGSLRLHFRGDS